MTFSEFLGSLKNVTYGFDELIAYITGFFTDIMISDHVRGTVGFLGNMRGILPYFILTAGLIVLFFGMRMFNFLRFTATFIAGALIGMYVLTPVIVVAVPAIPPIAVGVVTGLVAAFLSRIVYTLALFAVSGYSAYVVAYTGLIPILSLITKDNWIVSLVIAIGVFVLVLYLFRFMEILVTSFAGGYAVASVMLVNWWDYTNLLSGDTATAVFVLSLLLALVGLFVQRRNRKRYA